MNEIEFPTAAEVNELLEVAEARFGSDWDRHSAVRPLLMAASGCKAEAKAYANLRREVGR